MASKAQSGRKPFRAKKQQSRLSFSPLPSSAAAKDKYSAAIRDRLANVRYDGADTSSPLQRASDSGAHMLPTPGPSSRLRPESSSPLSNAPTTPERRAARQESEEEEEDELVIPSSKRRRTARNDNAADETPVRRSSRLQNTSPPRPGTPSSRSSEVFSHVEVPTPRRRPSGALSDLASAETSDEDGDVLVSKPAPRRRTNVNDSYSEPLSVSNTSRPSNRWPSGVDDWLVDDDEVEYISSDEEDAPKRRKPTKPPRTPRRRSRREQEELEDDLEDLQDSVPEESAKQTRTRGGPVTTKRDKAREHLDMLKRRRAGEKIPRIHDSDEDEDGVDINLIGRPVDDLSYVGSAHSSIDTEPEAEEPPLDEEDFIEDDTTGRLGRPHPDIPLEFTHFASAKPRELFPHIVEWLVKNKLAPAFTRNDALYKLAFDRVDDQVRAQAGSRLISSAWNATFVWTILARPQISIAAQPGMDDELIRCCDACNKTNRPARYDFVLSGDAYYKDSLEPVDNSDDEDDEADLEYDEAGHQLASQRQHFYLGSHCAANAQMGHKLTHWKYHLNESVLAYLEEQGTLSADAVVARDKMKHKKREKQAEATIDSMEETGKIEELWRDFQNDLDDARLGMEDYQKRGGRTFGRIGVIRSSGTDGKIREWRDNKYKETIRLDSDSDA